MSPVAVRQFSLLHVFVEIPSVLHNRAIPNAPHPPVLEPDWFSLPNPVVSMATKQHPAPSLPPLSSFFPCFSQCCFCSKVFSPPNTCSSCCGLCSRLKCTCMLNMLSGNRNSVAFRHVKRWRHAHPGTDDDTTITPRHKALHNGEA